MEIGNAELRMKKSEGRMENREENEEWTGKRNVQKMHIVEQ